MQAIESRPVAETPVTDVPGDRDSGEPSSRPSSESIGAGATVGRTASVVLRPFHRTVAALVVAWLLAIAIIALLSRRFPEVRGDGSGPALSWADCFFIAAASLVVALVAMAPGIVMDFRRGAAGAQPPASRANAKGLEKAWQDAKTLGLALEFSVSMLLRLVGTVALFMLCRYHLAASDRLIAGWVLGWYFWLGFVEVTWLCRAILRSPAAPSSADSV